MARSLISTREHSVALVSGVTVIGRLPCEASALSATLPQRHDGMDEVSSDRVQKSSE